MTRRFRGTREVIMRTSAWDEAVRFYESVLGLPVTLRTDAMVGFETGALCLYVEKGSSHAPVFEFMVADVEAAKQRLIAAGCSLQEEDLQIPRCYIRDPFGLVFNLAQARNEQ